MPLRRKAYEQAAEIMDAAKKSAKEMRLGAIDYADDVMGVAEQRLRDAGRHRAGEPQAD